MKVDIDTIINFGKHKGKTAKEILDQDPGYIEWMEDQSNFEVSDELSEMVFDALYESDYKNWPPNGWKNP